jgi:Uma2 family endonuclease
MDILKTIEKIAPQRRKMSYEDYLEFAGDSQIVEWVEEEVICYMPPTIIHQDLSGFLFYLLRSYVQFFKLGSVQYAPFEVKLWPGGPSREPDILFVATENLSKLDEKRFTGGPDLLIEIISPSSASEDRGRKFTQYEQAGVREYWLVDPRPRQQQADFYLLGSDGRYQAAPLSPEGRYYSLVLPDFWLNIEWLWQNPLPNPQRAFAEIMVSCESLPDEAKTIYQALLTYLSR